MNHIEPIRRCCKNCIFVYWQLGFSYCKKQRKPKPHPVDGEYKLLDVNPDIERPDCDMYKCGVRRYSDPPPANRHLHYNPLTNRMENWFKF